MAVKKINEINYLIDNNRIFLPSKNINIFPCSRRGQYSTADYALYYDPEARLNTERTNRISTAINGFTDRFIVNEDFNDSGDTLVFVLAGYRIEIKNFIPSDIAALLEEALKTTVDKIYAHLSLHKGVSLNVESYSTEILYRQSTEDTQTNYLDVSYGDTDYFFVGISFVKEPVLDSYGSAELTPHDLALFEKSDSSWKLVQTSLLPHIEHGETENSIKIKGNFTVEHIKDDGTTQTSFQITDGPIAINKATIYDLDVDTNIDTSTIDASTSVTTPSLKTNTITSDNAEIVVDKVLKVDTINSDSTNGLTIKQATKLDSTLTVDDEIIANNDIKVAANYEVDTPQLRVNRITSGGGSITIDNKDLVVNNKKVSAKEVAAEKITQNGNQVPAITLEQISDEGVTPEVWQLQITNVIKKPKN